MRNNKGFTIVELITSFALASVVMIFLFTIVMFLKNNFIYKSVKTDLIIKQSLLSKELNKDFRNNQLVSLNTCSTNSKCFEYHFVDGTTKKLTISDSGDMIKYGDYTYKLSDSSYAGKINSNIEYITVDNNLVNNGILIIEIPIYNKKYPDDNFGVKVIYQFNSNIYNISI